MTARDNPLKRAFAEDKVVCGVAVMSRSPILFEILGYSTFDFVFIDTEHVPIGSDITLENLIKAAEASNIVLIVRVKKNREHYIRNALEAGAQGVVIPHVASRQDAERAVNYARFPLRGIRGADPTVRSARYRCGEFSWEESITKSNEEPMVIPLLEDKEFLQALEAILSVDGIDALCFGPTDYALSLGLNLLYDYNHPKIAEAFDAVVERADKRGLPVLSAVNLQTVKQSNRLKQRGIRFQLFGTDIAHISATFHTLLQDVVSKLK
jgi:4-hydroxy-2-oxoheptanedioate aldolase